MSNGKSPFSALADHVGTILTTLLSASVIGVISIAITVYQQAIEVNHINESIHDMHVTLEELKRRSVSADVRLSVMEDSVKKLQSDMEDVKYREYRNLK